MRASLIATVSLIANVSLLAVVCMIWSCHPLVGPWMLYPGVILLLSVAYCWLSISSIIALDMMAPRKLASSLEHWPLAVLFARNPPTAKKFLPR